MPRAPARIRAKFLASCALTVAAVLVHVPAVTLAALAATCAAIPAATAVLGGAGLLRAVFVPHPPHRSVDSGRPTRHGSDDHAAAAETR